MCGRFVSASDPEQIAAYFDTAPPDTQLGPSYNVAPTTDVYAIVEGPDGTRQLQVFHWGLIPVWAKDVKIGQKMINARSETIAEKPAFRSSFAKHRMIIPMDGFYEWKRDMDTGEVTKAGKPIKQPFFIHSTTGEPLAVAGVWATWRDKAQGPDAPWLHSCSVVTTSANKVMSYVHNRMPVMLPQSAWAAWLDPDNSDKESLKALMVPAPDGLLEMHPVSTDVNNVRNKDVHLVDAVPSPAAG